MPEHRIGTREEWQAARDELAKLEAEQAERNEEIKRKRRELPGSRWRRNTSSTPRTARRRSPSSSTAARSSSPTTSCTARLHERGLPGMHEPRRRARRRLVHLNKRDVTLICFSRAPIDRSPPTGSGWAGSSLRVDLRDGVSVGLRARDDRGAGAVGPSDPGDGRRPARVAPVVGGDQVGAELKDGLREGPGWIAFARDNGTTTTPTR